jgi:hypothetical protein
MVSEDVNVWENGVKAWTAREYSPTHPRIKMWNKCLSIGGSWWGKGIELELATKAWAHKKNSFYKFSQLLIRNHLNWICISLCLVTPSWRGKMRHHWGNKKNKCQAITLYGSCVNLSNEKWNATCTSCLRVMGMQLYNQRRQRFKWKDPRTSNDETHVQANVGGVGTIEGIESWQSQGFGLDELDVW